MARQTLVREVTKTTAQVAKVEIVNGEAVAQRIEDQILIGNVDAEKAQRQLSKKLGFPVTVVKVEPDTRKYSMPVELFLEHATPVADDAVEEDDHEDDPNV